MCEVSNESLLAASSIPSGKERLTVAELAAHLGVAPHTIYRGVHRRKKPIPHYRITPGGPIFFRLSDVEAFFERQAEKGIEPKRKMKVSETTKEVLRAAGYNV